MVTIVGVRFKKAGKIYYFLPGEETLTIDDGVIVEQRVALNMVRL